MYEVRWPVTDKYLPQKNTFYTRKRAAKPLPPQALLPPEPPRVYREMSTGNLCQHGVGHLRICCDKAGNGCANGELSFTYDSEIPDEWFNEQTEDILFERKPRNISYVPSPVTSLVYDIKINSKYLNVEEVIPRLTSVMGWKQTPSGETVRAQIRVSPMQADGGQNDGLWILSVASKAIGGQKDYVLKVVNYQRKLLHGVDEVDNLQRVLEQQRHIMHDKNTAFPKKILRVYVSNRGHKYNIFVSRKARGVAMTKYIWEKLRMRQRDAVWKSLSEMGVALAQFHNRYRNPRDASVLQHGDFHTSNVFLQESTGRYTFIDIGAIGVKTSSSDVEQMKNCLRLLAKHYPGQELSTKGIHHFTSGYYAELV